MWGGWCWTPFLIDLFFFSSHSDAVSWEKHSLLRKKPKQQQKNPQNTTTTKEKPPKTNSLLYKTKNSVILILSVKNTEWELGCVGLRTVPAVLTSSVSSACLHPFALLSLQKTPWEIFVCTVLSVEESWAGVRVLLGMITEMVINVMLMELRFSKITALSNAASNVSPSFISRAGLWQGWLFHCGERGTEWRSVESNFLWHVSEEKYFTVRKITLIAEARCMLIARGLFLNPWAFFFSPLVFFLFSCGR